MSLKGKLQKAGITHFSWDVHEYPTGQWCFSSFVAWKRAHLPITSGSGYASADAAKAEAIKAIEKWEKENL